MSEWDKTVSFKAEDMLNVALEWVRANHGLVFDYLYWAQHIIEEKRGMGNITGEEKALFLIAVILQMKPTYLRSFFVDTLRTVIGEVNV
jgi:hypothetical protein